MWQAWDMALDLCLAQLPTVLENEDRYVHSSFFEDQLTAFQVWLNLGSKNRSPPEQLPIVLQVLLSQVHRLRALELLGRFLDLGPWAVNLALSVGIFPYVLKLLQSNARELRPLLVFIWAKILAVDNVSPIFPYYYPYKCYTILYIYIILDMILNCRLAKRTLCAMVVINISCLCCRILLSR